MKIIQLIITLFIVSLLSACNDSKDTVVVVKKPRPVVVKPVVVKPRPVIIKKDVNVRIVK
jgi:hypothetical protein